jgi:PAS domain S-box-containing protein
MNLNDRLPIIAVTVTAALCIVISLFSLKSGLFIIFQNFFYIPIVIACFYYRSYGFAISVALSCIYFFLIIAFTSDPMIIRDAVIRVIIFILIAAVITALSIARAQAEAALKKEREKFRTVADFTYGWEYWTDPQQNMRYVSPSCERISGYGPEEFMKEAGLIYSIVHPADREIFKSHADHYHESHIDSVGEVEFRIATRNGKEQWIAHLCQPVYSSDGQFLGRRASNRDITERKLAEEERESLISELQKALSEVKKLSGLLPICASCKKIRDDKGYWNQIESYIRDHSEAEFSHGICPDCLKKLYPELYK